MAQSESTLLPASGAVLIGGRSSRFGSDKAFLQFAGRPISKRLYDLLSTVVQHVFFVSDNREKIDRLNGTGFVDKIRSRGPLGGLYTALLHSRFDRCFLLACDMPFISADLLRFLWKNMADTDVTIPVWQGRTEPLVALYRRSCLKEIRTYLKNDALDMRGFWTALETRTVDVSETFSPEQLRRYFFNINTPDDYDILETIESNRDGDVII